MNIVLGDLEHFESCPDIGYCRGIKFEKVKEAICEEGNWAKRDPDGTLEECRQRHVWVAN